jgi:uncharacterized membrane protein YfcA
VALTLALALLMGVTLGVLGGGGSILSVPILHHVAGLEAKPAIATSLLVVGIASAATLVPRAFAGNVRWRTGAVFGAASAAGALAGGWLARFVPGPLLLAAFAAVMLGTGVAMWRGPSAGRQTGTARPERHPIRSAVDGVVVGAVTGLVGAGGGFLIVPALVLLGGLPMRDAVGTSLLVIALNSLAGFTGYVSHVAVDFGLALAVAGAALVGSVAGALVSNRVDPARLRRGFAGFVVAMAVWMLWDQAIELGVL